MRKLSMISGFACSSEMEAAVRLVRRANSSMS
jgi:hypothetical protein